MIPKALEACLAEVRSLISREGAELVEIKASVLSGVQTLSILIEKKGGGVSLTDCERVSRKIAGFFDEAATLTGDNVLSAYNLEVSSPGIDRPLRTREDFLRYEDSCIRLFFHDSVKPQSIYEKEVRIVSASPEALEVMILKDSKLIRVEYQHIVQGLRDLAIIKTAKRR